MTEKEYTDSQNLANIQKIKAEARKVNSEAKKISAEAKKFEAEAKKIEAETAQIIANIEMSKKEKEYSPFDMLILSHVMTASSGGSESYSQKQLFSDDDLIDYKQKMLSILKQI